MAIETVKIMRNAEYPPTGFRLDMLRPPPLKPEVADEIGIKYGRVPLKAKTKFHIDQMKVDIWRLGVLRQRLGLGQRTWSRDKVCRGFGGAKKGSTAPAIAPEKRGDSAQETTTIPLHP